MTGSRTKATHGLNLALLGLLASFLIVFLFFPIPALADSTTGEALYKDLSALAANGDNRTIEELNTAPRSLDWSAGTPAQFKGHLRFLTSTQAGSADQSRIFFVRSTDGQIHILAIPDRENPLYQGLEDLIDSKLNFNITILDATISGKVYQFAQFITPPEQPLLDKIFKLAIILMLFLVMVGMGLTLTGKDFATLIAKPKGIVIGAVLQFGIMPLIAVALGYLMGFYSAFPYIYVGMVLITVTPGGVTSNLMTHYAKGDVALSVSLTTLSTILSIFFVPLLLNAYCANMPEVEVPTKTITLTIVVLVIIPLAIGMLFRKFKEELAKKLIPVFSILGIIALLFLIVAGILSNLENFADTTRHGVLFYTMILLLTFSGMVAGAIVPLILRVTPAQVRAISLETGLRNASLAMTIALLIQDSMGDFYSSMFWTSGMFGLAMYVAGIVAIKAYPKLIPIPPTQAVQTQVYD